MDTGIRDTHHYKAIKFGHDTGWIVLALLAVGLLIFCVLFGFAVYDWRSAPNEPFHYEM
jgi:hypothetical protein